MSIPKTPCIGICSTTSLGDNVCRGCRRYSFEVIKWNSYDPQEKTAVLTRIERLIGQDITALTSLFDQQVIDREEFRDILVQGEVLPNANEAEINK